MTIGKDHRKRAQKLLKMFDHPVYLKVKSRIFKKEGAQIEIFTDMAELGLEKCWEDLMDIFICLLWEARKTEKPCGY